MWTRPLAPKASVESHKSARRKHRVRIDATTEPVTESGIGLLRLRSTKSARGDDEKVHGGNAAEISVFNINAFQ